MSPALQAVLARVIPSYMQAVNGERERQVVMAVLEALTGVLRSCGSLALQPPGRLAELCTMLKAVLQRKVSRAGGCGRRYWAGGVHSVKYKFNSLDPSTSKGKKAGDPRLS